MQQEDLCECITSKPRLIKSLDPSIDLLGGEMLFLPLSSRGQKPLCNHYQFQSCFIGGQHDSSHYISG
nr:MAG TPA: hypothetical protein [Caudoviricetes sp.]